METFYTLLLLFVSLEEAALKPSPPCYWKWTLHDLFFSLLLFFWCQGRGLNTSLLEPWGLGPWRANDSTILPDPMIFFFFFIQQEAKMFLIETVQISNPAAVTLLKHQRRSSFQMVNSILAFTISLLLFFRAGTTFALNTFACGMTSSMPFTSTSTTSVSTTSFSSLPSCTLHSLLGVCVFSGMVETASP